MTIIKISKDGKLVGKKMVYEETTVPLTPGSAETGMRVEYTTARSTKRMVNMFLLLIAFLVLCAGIVGGIYIYKFMAHKHKMERVTIDYTDEPHAEAVYGSGPAKKPEETMSYTMVEDIDIRVEEEIERIEVPKFDECRRSVIMHDFHLNYTVIVDQDDNECFIMDLDRTKMQPPKTFAELVRKYASGYYMPKVDVVRNDYTVVTPKLTDLRFAGPAIAAECVGLDSYMLEKREPVPLLKVTVHYSKTYGFSNLKELIKDRIHK